MWNFSWPFVSTVYDNLQNPAKPHGKQQWMTPIFDSKVAPTFDAEVTPMHGATDRWCRFTYFICIEISIENRRGPQNVVQVMQGRWDRYCNASGTATRSKVGATFELKMGVTFELKMGATFESKMGVIHCCFPCGLAGFCRLS